MKTHNRPLSPHLQIYKPQLTSVMSICHRATGVALVAGALLLVWWVIAAAVGPEVFDKVQKFLTSWLGILILFIFTCTLMYHLCNGIRHLFWDAGYGFRLEDVYKSGWITLSIAVLLTSITWIFVIILRTTVI
ncbi:Succinate dehydrogenase, cytochrome b556 subunit [Candidatus Endolissoclinum faulkneri L5]|uniref:Succinate dehydrogenase cytochrome b556 subunit n=1 Tax=Candidatus Endolissoclinum faulkneri L5 TaxID=1401328 RepID=V9TVB3_9PROT|nr:succinate dehydrogenase, cytochrome b556 subunit [Candidatus Endolissoclinum faulkneri]AHC73638.1 Succinate dehydrogenase, cytochrome b556 subunit [Candidatus Endolissoclinum faulkneri L5]